MTYIDIDREARALVTPDGEAFIALGRRGLHAWWRYAATIVFALVAGLLLAVVAVIAAQLLFMRRLDVSLHGLDPLALLALTLAQDGGFLVGLAAGIRQFHRKRLADVTGPMRLRDFRLGFVVWLVLAAAAAAIDYAIAPGAFVWGANAQTPALIAVVLLVIPVQTFVEEFFFRGYLLQGLLHASSRAWLAVIVCAAIFGVLHYSNSAQSAVAAVAFGVAAGIVTLRTGSIALSFGLHFANNLFSSVIVINRSDVFANFPALIAQTSPALDWFDVIVESAGLAILVWLVWRATRPVQVEAAEA